MTGENKWRFGPANDNSDNPVDELGRPLVKPEESSEAPEDTKTVSETIRSLPLEEWIDGEPPEQQK